MFGGLNRLLAAALVAGAVLVVPSQALAGGCGGGPSAQNVYTECLQTGGGGKSTSGSHSSGGGQGSTNSTGSPSAPLSRQTAKALKQAGSDGKTISTLVRGYGSARLLQGSHSPTGEPTAIGSAFDLGSGPTLLLILLAGTAVLLLGATGFRYTRQRR